MFSYLCLHMHTQVVKRFTEHWKCTLTVKHFSCIQLQNLGQDSAVSLYNAYSTKQAVWKITVQFLARTRDFSLLKCVQTSTWAHPASYLMGTGVSLSSSKVARTWSWLLTPRLSADVKTEGSYTYTPQYAFMITLPSASIKIKYALPL